MKKIILSVFVTTIFLFNLHASNNNFEGTMTWNVTEKKTEGSSASSISLLIKNNKVAFSMGASDKTPKMVLDLTTGQFYAVVDQGQQKMVMKLDVKVLQGIGGLATVLGSGYGSVLNAKDNKVELTSETKTVNGYKCKKYTFKNAENQGEIWASDEVPFNFSALFDIMNLSASWKESGFTNAMPLSGTSTNLKTKEVSTFSVNIQPKTMADDAFTIPEGYPVMDMTAMFQQMLQTNDPAQIEGVFKKMTQPK